eukprot:TRINITY_DN6042_c0_g4_i1.p1 TRINITY_DN6042_c0_g4~~TRINITY_DN6042_c0_g4_i1.p1  ORF type:complete len:100 (+),score=1.75 TRINITY_DN6042_c0_g4_i1:265-564(+)
MNVTRFLHVVVTHGPGDCNVTFKLVTDVMRCEGGESYHLLFHWHQRIQVEIDLSIVPHLQDKIRVCGQQLIFWQHRSLLVRLWNLPHSPHKGILYYPQT